MLHRLLMICKACGAHEMVASIWVWIPCRAGTPFRRINEKLGAETDNLAMTYKLEVATVDGAATLWKLVADSVGSGAMTMSSGTQCL